VVVAVLDDGMGQTMKTDQRGFSLIEVMVALSILLIVALGLIPLGVIATSTTENQGHLDARVTEYAQDKLEQLLALAYADGLTDTRVFPAAATGGSGLAVGGNSNPTAAGVDRYVDYLDINGTLIPSVGGAEPAGWFYKRVWQITVPQANLKQVTVSAIVKTQVGRIGLLPRATVTALKTSPF
jgi:prepilin-type N-terminal cleavage/methylation domain-containing protein